VVAAALLPASGCSFLVVDPPPEHPAPYDQITCTTSYAGPTVDTVLVVLHLVSWAIVGSSSGDAYGGAKSRNLAIQFDAPVLGAEIGAAIWGYRKVAACNELIASHGPNRQRGYPRAYRPPPATIEPRTSPPEPVIEPPAPATAPAPAAPRARQQTDEE
jgi:hypothetical protein